MKAAQNFLASFRRKIALNIRDYKNQCAEQYRDFDDIIQKKLNTPTQTSRNIQAQFSQNTPDNIIEPFHSQNFILNE